MTAIQEVLNAHASQPPGGRPARIERRLEEHRESAIDALKRAQSDLTDLLDGVLDDDTWIGAARKFTTTAGYSGTIEALTSEARAHLAMVAGIVQAVA